MLTPTRLLLIALLALCPPAIWAQSVGNAGTVDGLVTDPSGAAVRSAQVEIRNPITGYQQKATTDESGAFRFRNIPPNPYHLQVTATSFGKFEQDVTVRNAVPVSLKIPLAIAGGETSVTVESGGADLLENVPYAHTDVDRAAFNKLPTLSPGSGLSDAITQSSPGVVADSNGFFHPLGDHAQTSFYIDGQPINDQQSKGFSTQIPLGALQSMELITGAPNAEFGDKTSLVVSASTRSGLGQKTFGSISSQYGLFGTGGGELTLGTGTATFGNFLLISGLRSGRFLDTPEFYPVHAIGSNLNVFDRVDYQPNGTDSFHMNIFGARNFFQVPNTYDQPNQDQRQRVTTLNLAPTYQRTFSPQLLFTLNTFFRQDRVDYFPSRDLMNDVPATISENRHLTNYGIKADAAYVRGAHNVRAGAQLMQTRLAENFSLGITDPGYNAICVDRFGGGLALPGVTNPNGCAGLGYTTNPDLQPGLVSYDLTRGGRSLRFSGRQNVNQYAFYVQDQVTLGGLGINAGLRIDHYNAIVEETGVQPRVGLSYLLKRSGTVLRASYSRTFETPYNENLILSSSTGAGGLAANVFGAAQSEPIRPGRRNQFNTGFQQSIGRFLQADADYFWKYTDNAFDFGTLLNTPIVFPISWRKSKIDGVSVRVSTPDLKGFQATTTMGHTRARYFGPSNGGLIFNDQLSSTVFRIDHDQAFQQTTQLRYQHAKDGPWFAFTWRYDSGLVAGAVGSIADAFALTPAQQAAIGFSCGSPNGVPTIAVRIEDVNSLPCSASRIHIPANGTADDDHNPFRISPRHIFGLGTGIDNLFKTDKYKTTLKFTVQNLSNQVALYNFLSTFSGTHFVTPRAYQAELGFVSKFNFARPHFS